MLISLLSFAIAEEPSVQVVGPFSQENPRDLFSTQYNCGTFLSGSVLECYDLGKNVFNTRVSTKDYCRLYTFHENTFVELGSLSFCMESLVKPISKGEDILYILASFNLALVVTNK
ncbi:MAG: hypothetical protein Q8R18_03300 [bacterium]|nr:hypothetical protein [bacterium]